MHSLYMTGRPAGAQSSLDLVQSGQVDVASASCPGGVRSFRAYLRTHTLKQRRHTELIRHSNESFHSVHQ